jgi:hypothetical protein
MKLKKDVAITLGSGVTVIHSAELLDIRHTADGASVASAACCGKVGAIITCSGCAGSGCPACGGKGSIKDEDTRSDHAFYDIAGMSEADLMAEIQGHVDRVANHHAGAHRAREFMASLTAADPVATDAPGKVG